jgi:hypothetical protein
MTQTSKAVEILLVVIVWFHLPGVILPWALHVALGIFNTSILCLWHLCVCTQLDFALDSMQLIVRGSDGTCV